MLARKSLKDITEYNGTYPVYISPKLDGYRCRTYLTPLNDEVQAFSRTNKLIPNKYIQKVMKETGITGLDGELTCGTTFKESAQVTKINPDVEPFDFVFNVFDIWSSQDNTKERFEELELVIANIKNLFPKYAKHFNVVPHLICNNLEDLRDNYEVVKTEEGAMLNLSFTPYVEGKTHNVIKVKRYFQEEAKITGFKVEKFGENLKKVPEHLWGTEKQKCSGLIVKGLEGGSFAGRQFNIGTGFDDATKQKIYRNQDTLLNKVVTFKYVKSGTQEGGSPRHPVFLGFREEWDMD